MDLRPRQRRLIDLDCNNQSSQEHTSSSDSSDSQAYHFYEYRAPQQSINFRPRQKISYYNEEEDDDSDDDPITKKNMMQRIENLKRGNLERRARARLHVSRLFKRSKQIAAVDAATDAAVDVDAAVADAAVADAAVDVAAIADPADVASADADADPADAASADADADPADDAVPAALALNSESTHLSNESECDDSSTTNGFLQLIELAFNDQDEQQDEQQRDSVEYPLSTVTD